MYSSDPPQLPGRTTILRRCKRFFALLGATSILAGLIASTDAIFENFFVPSARIVSVVGEPTEIAGTITSGQLPNTPSPEDLHVEIRPSGAQFSVSSAILSKSLLSGDIQWRIPMMPQREALVGIYEVSVSLAAHDSNHLIPIGIWRLDLFSTAAECNAHRSSFLARWFGVAPLDVAIWALFLALFSGASYYALLQWISRLLSANGYLRVYHAKEDGDDTLLYCVDAKNMIEPTRSYSVCSAAGQLLGTADVSESGRRYCVFRLYAARARAGCVIALGAA